MLCAAPPQPDCIDSIIAFAENLLHLSSRPSSFVLPQSEHPHAATRDYMLNATRVLPAPSVWLGLRSPPRLFTLHEYGLRSQLNWKENDCCACSAACPLVQQKGVSLPAFSNPSASFNRQSRTRPRPDQSEFCMAFFVPDSDGCASSSSESRAIRVDDPKSRTYYSFVTSSRGRRRLRRRIGLCGHLLRCRGG